MLVLSSVLTILIWTHSCVNSQNEEGVLKEDDSTSIEELDQQDVGNDLKTHSSVYFLENFNNKENFLKSWVVSEAKKKTDDGSTLQYDGDWITEKATKDSLPNDLGLTFNIKAKHRAISSKLFREFPFTNRPFIVQYEVLHQDGQECGGAYLKLISKSRPVTDLSVFNDKTPYTIMFGPDKCGTVNKLHFIFQHKNPLNGSFEEKHCKPPKSRIDETFTDAKPHLFKLIVNPDNTFSLSVDHKVINDGSLLEDFEPPVNPPREIDDPYDKKPSDWDDREKIPDPTAKKPDDWDETAPPEIPDVNAVRPEGWLEDEPINISDPSAEKPDDWDDEMDGEWEAPLVPNPACEDAPGCGPWSPPLISNPAYKGKWSPPLITNPDFKGIWKPRRIPNPDYFEDKQPYRMSPIDAVGFELWSISSRIMFDNIIITDDDSVAKQFAAITFDKKILSIEKSADTLLNQFIAFTNRYPWLWALYLVVLLIPITLIVVCCFWSSKDSDAERKKTDEHSPDTVHPLVDDAPYSSLASGSDFDEETMDNPAYSTKDGEGHKKRDSSVPTDADEESRDGSSIKEGRDKSSIERSTEESKEEEEDEEEEEEEEQSKAESKASDEDKQSNNDEKTVSGESSNDSHQPETVLKKRK